MYEGLLCMRDSACSNLSLKTLFTVGENITIVKEKYEAESNYLSYIFMIMLLQYANLYIC